MDTFWRRCSSCKKEIRYGAKYSMCSVASCSKVRAPVQFCSADCWAVHEEISTHKDAWAVEQTAPRSAEVAAQSPATARDPAPQTTSSPPRPSGPTIAVRSSGAPSLAVRVLSSPQADAAPAAPLAPGLSPTGGRLSGGGPASGSARAGEGLETAPPKEFIDDGDEIMIVVSKLKDFVKDVAAGMSTSEQVNGPLSRHVRRLATLSIESAHKNGRKTILGRDVPRPAPQGNDDVLVVVSRLKEYVRKKADLRTSDEVPGVISEELRKITLAAIDNAKLDGRKTVMGRDVPQ